MEGQSVFKSAAPWVYGVLENNHPRVSALHIEKGLLATVSHPLEDPKAISIVTGDGKTVSAEVLGWDNRYDVAFLQAEIPDVPGDIGNITELEPGQSIYSLGMDARGLRIHQGLVAQVSPRRDLPMGGILEPAVEVDGSLSHSMSGGGLFGSDAKPYGMNSLLPRDRGMTLDMPLLQRLAAEIRQRGSAKPGFLGVVSVEARTGDGRKGLIITEVRRDSPAHKGGLKTGDIILTIAGESTESSADLFRILRRMSQGEEAKILILRGESEQTITIALGSR